MKQMKFSAAMMDYFGRQPEQTLSEFMVELRKLTPADREWFKVEFPKVGYEIIE